MSKVEIIPGTLGSFNTGNMLFRPGTVYEVTDSVILETCRKQVGIRVFEEDSSETSNDETDAPELPRGRARRALVTEPEPQEDFVADLSEKPVA